MICRLCGSAMAVDVLVVSDVVRELDPWTPVPIIYRCQHGHTVRRSEAPRPLPAVSPRLTPRCAVCGVDIVRRPGAASRKSCSRDHYLFIEQKRKEAKALHHAHLGGVFSFLIEAQPWYQGTATAYKEPIPTPVVEPVADWPTFPEIPASWLDGFRACYPDIEADIEPGLFPLVDDEDAMGAFKTTQRYTRTRRKGRHVPRPEQRLAWPPKGTGYETR